MAENYTNDKFLLVVNEYEEILNAGYLKEVENAVDKKYAAELYQTALFTKNELVPYQSILFNELLYTFEHFSKLLGLERAYEQTFSLLEKIEYYTATSLEKAKKHLQGDREVRLPTVYLRFLSEEELTLSDLIRFEEEVAKFTVENLSGCLALHVAGCRLMERYSPDEHDAIEGLDRKGGYTLNERALTLYFLLASLGFKQGLNEDRTALASLYHLIMDKNFNEATVVKNSNIYRALSNVPHVVKDASRFNEYLKNIRPFFEKVGMKKALEQIDEHLNVED